MYLFTITLRRIHLGLRVVAETKEPSRARWPSVEEPLNLDPAALPEFVAGPEEVKDYGATLGRAVFAGEIRPAFERIRATAEARREPLHVLLSVEADELVPLRWERLCGPLDGDWRFLRLQQRT